MREGGTGRGASPDMSRWPHREGRSSPAYHPLTIGLPRRLSALLKSVCPHPLLRALFVRGIKWDPTATQDAQTCPSPPVLGQRELLF